MPIEHIVVENFKSYGGRHLIGPFKTFTAVIGPNGSGKSNLMDAISFVLGVRTKTLRGSHLKELIHGKETDAGEQTRSAFVELVYVHDQAPQASSDGASEAEDVVRTCFRRSISPSGVAQYSIDGKVVRWEEYNKRLQEIGIIVRARNFLVFQGDVESIAQKSPEELTQLFEQISGSAELKEDYDSLKEAMEEAEENFRRSFEKKRSVNKEEKQIRHQKEEADRYEELVEEQQRLKTEFFLFQLFHMQKDVDVQREEMEDKRKELEEARASFERVETFLKDLSRDTAEARLSLSKQDKAVTKRKQDIQKLKPAQIKLHEQVEYLERSIKKHEADMEKLRESAEKQSEEIKSLETELQGVDRAAVEFEAEEQGEGGEALKLAQSQLTQYRTLREEASQRTAGQREEVERLQREPRLGAEEMEALQARIDTLKRRREELQRQLSDLSARRERMTQHVSETEKRLQESREKRESISAESSRIARRREELTARLAETEAQLSEARVDMRENERSARMTECMESLKRLFPGVRGRIADLCRPTQRRYNVAVCVAMGIKNMEAVVVDTEKTAIACINYMKDQRIGSATFLPLDSIKTRPIREADRHLGGTLKLVIDVLQFDEAYQKAILYVCGNALVCDTLDEARRFCFGSPHDGGAGQRRRGVEDFDMEDEGGEDDRGALRHKVVTLDGTVIHKSGNMTGGDGGGAAADRSASRWEEKEVVALRQTRDALQRELAQLGGAGRAQETAEVEQQTALDASISGLENRLRYSRVDLEVTAEKELKAQTETEHVDAEIARLLPQLQQSQASVAAAQQRLDRASQRLHREEDRIFADFSRSVGVASIREYEEQQLQRAQQRVERRLALQEQRARLQSQLEYERHRDMDGPLEAAQKRVQDSRRRLKQARNEVEQVGQRLKSAHESLEKTEAERTSLMERLEQLLSEAREHKGRAAQERSQIVRLERELSARESRMDQLGKLRQELLQSAQLEQVKVPILGEGEEPEQEAEEIEDEEDDDEGEGGEEGEQSDDGSSRKKRKIRGAPKRKHRGGGGSPQKRGRRTQEEVGGGPSPLSWPRVDFSALKRNREIHSEEEFREATQGYQSSLARIEAEKEQIAPNLKAVEQLQEFRERVHSAVEEFEVEKRAAKVAHDRFEAKRQERYDLFMQAFDQIAEDIKEIYKALTQSREFPLGGTAYLTLENTEEPYLKGIKYTAMPPNKRWRDMEQLSGGEKTVAALALLFAVHSYRSAPFFVLDEIDAALDNINVNKVSNYVRERARRDGLQSVVISLKDSFYMKADGLIGVYRDVHQHSSGVLTQDLEHCDQ